MADARAIKALGFRVSPAKLVRVKSMSTQEQRLTGRRRQERNARVLRAHPLCVQCQLRGDVQAAVEVDHVVPLHLGGKEDDANLQGLCRACHAAKSADESRARGVLE